MIHVHGRFIREIHCGALTMDFKRRRPQKREINGLQFTANVVSRELGPISRNCMARLWHDRKHHVGGHHRYEPPQCRDGDQTLESVES